ncbi:DEAD/DEAH box helicase [Cellulomonas dongxiuzhuiae]|uniref:DEAD/DEAH box helicase n=1 Tax=Cellulomonas dongxiuzhuiae TaxID=2819979 RepID=A0ABX8GGU7_9CELL|nr:DEAD/DEAH box helicase [Cellulomonas dongxiuzhuiae]MBO3094318.1 DEAD/DEAH box helicase [Cellulomonas dongxiuzhuiae]QWC15359.1 DEAD/DEAH box helicase [Cellulomonas dongxiuzhuiae]
MDPGVLLDVLLAGGRRADRATHVRELPARAGVRADWPTWADGDLVRGYRTMGVDRPWAHQVDAADAAWSGRHTVLATSTGSGKSLAFWLPALSAVRRGAAGTLLDPGRIESVARRPTVLYLSPTKALAADQLAGLERLLVAAGTRDVRVATCDGDTSRDERRWVREHADVVLTNPDFLHFALLPAHGSWSRLLSSLAYVVVDECHAFRGLFGAHVALVLRRLRRLAAAYGAAPVVVLASATTSDPAASAARLLGVTPADVHAVTEDTSPAGRKTVVLWQPPELPGSDSPWAALLPAEDPWSTVITVPAGDGSAQDAVGPEGPDDRGGAAGNGGTGGGGTGGSGGAGVSGEPGGAGAPGPAAGSAPAPEGSGPVGTGERLVAVPPDRPRRTATAEVADLLADLVAAGARVLAFTRSRRGAESVAAATRDHLAAVDPTLSSLVSSYRGGYLPEERRALERAIRDGHLRALATTNALELGVDISGLDAVLIAGWPGTRVSLWQQAGRAGRAGADGLVVLVAREDPLDTYLVHHPEAALDAPVEATVFDPGNPYVLAPHLCAAAAERPLRAEELDLFGPRALELLTELTERGILRRRASGWYWTHAEPASRMTDLRGAGGEPVRVVETATGRLLGTVDAASADATVHPGAVYVHLGVTYVVDELHLEDGAALATRRDVDHGTWARWVTSTTVVDVERQVDWGPLTWSYGQVDVTTQVVGYQRRRIPDLQVLSTHELDLPARTLRTSAVWWTAPPEVLAEAGVTLEVAPGALHAAEHASIGLLPLLATCDRWDLGGLSTLVHPDTGHATVFVHDGHPGGAGFAERGFELGPVWLTATRDAIAACPCATGCPACVQSPKCGNANEPLDKAGALRLLTTVLTHATP